MEITKSKEHTLICSDVFEGLNIIPDKSVDLIFIDPPYNIGKIFENTEDHW